MNPLVSVIIPARSSAKTITEAIKSIQNQTYRNLEIIVVDDNSADNTKEVVENIGTTDPRVSFFSLPYDDPNRFNKQEKNINAGYMARNYGFKKVRGEWITFQDADDASLLNRIETQYALAKKYNASHITTDWIQFDEKYVGKKLSIDTFSKKYKIEMVGPEELYALSQKTKGFAAKIFPALNVRVPFHVKRMRFVNKLFFGSLAPYPGAGNSPLFKRKVIDGVKFRPLSERIWPSFTGRGADRDFNFQIAETFKNSFVFFIPLYMWRQKTQNERYVGYEKYII